MLKRPLLDDHLSRGKATVRRTLEVVCDLCVMFIYIYLVHALVIYAFLLVLTFILSCFDLTVKNIAGKVNSKLLQRRGSTSPKLNRTRFDRKVNEAI